LPGFRRSASLPRCGVMWSTISTGMKWPRPRHGAQNGCASACSRRSLRHAWSYPRSVAVPLPCRASHGRQSETPPGTRALRQREQGWTGRCATPPVSPPVGREGKPRPCRSSHRPSRRASAPWSSRRWGRGKRAQGGRWSLPLYRGSRPCISPDLEPVERASSPPTPPTAAAPRASRNARSHRPPGDPRLATTRRPVVSRKP
jgi:hypothetical protein